MYWLRFMGFEGANVGFFGELVKKKAVGCWLFWGIGVRGWGMVDCKLLAVGCWLLAKKKDKGKS